MAKKYKLTQDGPEVQALLNKIDELKANIAPVSGETPTALESLSLEGVLYSVLTKAVNDLLNYYTKDETYTKEEVADAISNLVQSLTASSKKIWAGTAEEYALLTPSNDTVYFIKP